MAKGKKTFIFYSDWINMIKEMPNEDAGILIKHILSYVNDENPQTDNLLVKMAFGHMKPLIKQDLKKWESIREKRKQAGAKGGKQTQANAKQNEANAKQVQAVNDNVNVINKSIISQPEVDIDFDKLLESYNTLTGKNTRKVTDKAKRQIKARYKDGYTKTDIWNAMLNCSKDKFHKENNYKYFTLEFITREDKLNNFLSITDREHKHDPDAQENRKQDWL
jgi:hypothetical protein